MLEDSHPEREIRRTSEALGHRKTRVFFAEGPYDKEAHPRGQSIDANPRGHATVSIRCCMGIPLSNTATDP